MIKEIVKKEFTITSDFGLRIDKFLTIFFKNYSRSYFQYLLKEQAVFINKKVAKKNQILKENDFLEISFLPLEEMSVEAEDIFLDILFEDENLLVINKPANMVVHPAPGNPNNTIANALLHHCKKLIDFENSLRPGIVHRLDKNTTGVLITAKNIKTHQKLIEMFSSKKIKKDYLAITLNKPNEEKISAPIGRHPKKRKEMAVFVKNAKDAETTFKVLAYNDKYSLLLASPITGRTHQIRVHLKHLNCPIIGDEVYGNLSINKKFKIYRQLLHAYRIEFTHPITKENMKIIAPLPEDFKKFLKSFNFSNF